MKDKKYAILGDVHGNWEALQAVLADAESKGVNDFVCVGDIVGYNANPKECLEKMRELCSAIVRGNHDHYCAHDECLDDFHPLAANVVDWTRRHLSDEQIAFLRDLKLSKKIGGFTIVHSTLDMPHKWGYVFDPLEADANFNYQMTSVCFHGHTHVPIAYIKQDRVISQEYTKVKTELGKKYFFNVGSVGQPRDGDPRSSYATYDMTERAVELHRVEYDIASAQAKIREAGLPEKLAKRLEFGK
jgi:diadenosine tetraphosphatase ApaH/serine/threonine PP2A family protein phosphatase